MFQLSRLQTSRFEKWTWWPVKGGQVKYSTTKSMAPEIFGVTCWRNFRFHFKFGFSCSLRTLTKPLIKSKLVWKKIKKRCFSSSIFKYHKMISFYNIFASFITIYSKFKQDFSNFLNLCVDWILKAKQKERHIRCIYFKNSPELL